MEGKAEDQDDESGGGGERDRQRRVRRPRRQRLGAPMYDRKLAVRRMKAAHRPIRRTTVGERNFQNAGGSTKRGQRLRGAEHVDQPASDHPGLERRGGADRAVGIGDDLMADAGDDDAVAVGNQHLAAGRARPGRHHAFELGLQPTVGAGPSALQPFEPIDEEIGAAFDLLDDLADRLATMVQHLHDRADADREEECDDQRGDGTSQSRLGGEQPPICGLGDRLSQSLD